MHAFLRLIGLSTFVFVLVLGFTAMVGSCLPVSQKITSPLVCPSNYTKSFVSTETYDSYDGSSRFQSKLYCVEKSGKTREVRQFRIASRATFILCTPIFILLTISAFTRREEEQ